MSKNVYIVEAFEVTIGYEYYTVTVPKGTAENEVHKNFKMASKYAWVRNDDDPEDYDEHFKEMVEFRENANGQDTFNYYLEHICGYKVAELRGDFRYEW